MEPFENVLTVSINEEWFMYHFEKVIKSHVKNVEDIELILVDLRCVLRNATEI